MSCSHSRNSCGCSSRASRNLLRSCGCSSLQRAARSCSCNNRNSRSGCSSCNSRSGCGCDNCNDGCGSGYNFRSGCSSCNSRSGYGCDNCNDGCGSGYNFRSGCSSCNSRSGCGCDNCSECGGFNNRHGSCGSCSGCCKQYPFYTGPCPSACPCRTGVCAAGQCCPSCPCSDCGCRAQVTIDWNCGCGNSNCGSRSGCSCNDCSCGDCGNDCGNCDGDCSNNCDGDCDDCGTYASAGSCAFVSVTPVNVAAGGSIPFAAGSAADGFHICGGAVSIEQSGTYYASYTVAVPADVTLCTGITPSLGGVLLPAGAVRIDKDCTGSGLTVSGQAIFTADADALFALTSSADLNLTCVSPFISLNILRLG